MYINIYDLYISSNHHISDIISIRSYDISITYDAYYETPRIWLFGYNEVKDRNKILFSFVFESLF